MKRSPFSQSGFLSLGLIRLVLPLVLLWMGGQGLYTALTNRTPLSISFADYVRQRPDAKWVELTDVQLDLTEAISSGTLGSMSEVYIPLHAAGEAENAEVQALLLTRDEAVLALLRQMKDLPDEKAGVEFVLKNHEQLFPKRTVSGLVQFGLDSNSKKRRKIARLDANLAKDFAVIEEGKAPGILPAIGLLFAAVVAVWLCWLKSWSGSKKDATPPPIPPTPPDAPPLTQVR